MLLKSIRSGLILLPSVWLLFGGLLAQAGDGLRLSEFMASNNSTLADEDGDFSDWIEIYNAATNTRSLNDQNGVSLAQIGPRPTSFPGLETTNRAARFDGLNDFIIAGPNLLNHSSAFTLAGWIRPAGLSSSRVGLWGQSGAVTVGFLTTTNLQLWTLNGGSLTLAYPFPQNQWHHVAATGDGESLKVYFDGEWAGTGGVGTTDYGGSTAPFLIGAAAIMDPAGRYFSGQLDEVSVHDRALSEQEILVRTRPRPAPPRLFPRGWPPIFGRSCRISTAPSTSASRSRCLQLNSQFHELAFLTETVDTEMLSRQGFDPDGALYKSPLMLNLLPEPAIGGRIYAEGEKQTRLDEPGFADLTELVTGLCETNSVAARRRYLFDNVNIPAVVNFMALFHITQQGDGGHANVVPYRDSNGNREWRLLPWDMNISFGQIYGGDHIVAADDNDIAHPFYGSFDYRTAATTWSYNRMQDAIIRTPETREMYVRRLRTLMDEWLQPPSTPPSQLKLERRINELREQVRPEADLDRKKWGWDSGINGLGQLTFDKALDQLMTHYLAARRVHFFVSHNVNNPGFPKNAGIPGRQPANLSARFGEIEFNPASGNQAEEYIQLINTNRVTLDISEWKISGAISHTFAPGTVIPSNSVLYLSPDVNAFRARATGPRGKQGLFVQGNYREQLSARGESLQQRPRGRGVSVERRRPDEPDGLPARV